MAVANAVAEGDIKVVPEVLVSGGGGSIDGLAATLMRYFGNRDGDGLAPADGIVVIPEPPATPPPA